MKHYVVEVRLGQKPIWKSVNVIVAESTPLALTFAEGIRSALHAKIPKHAYRVRRVDYKDYLTLASELARRYGCTDRVEELENLVYGCRSLIVDP